MPSTKFSTSANSSLIIPTKHQYIFSIECRCIIQSVRSQRFMSSGAEQWLWSHAARVQWSVRKSTRFLDFNLYEPVVCPTNSTFFGNRTRIERPWSSRVPTEV